MDPTARQWRFQPGDEVYGADDSKLGKVVAVLPDAARPAHLLVEEGLLFHRDYYVPVEAVAHYDAGRVYLTVGKAEALHRGWDALPAAAAATGEPPAAAGGGEVARSGAVGAPADVRPEGVTAAEVRAPDRPGDLATPGPDRPLAGDVDAADVPAPGVRADGGLTGRGTPGT